MLLNTTKIIKKKKALAVLTHFEGFKTFKKMQDNEELINESYAFVEYFKTHPLISLNALEKKLNIPQSTLSKAVKGHRPIPIGYWYKLSLELKDYGYHIENYITVTITEEE